MYPLIIALMILASVLMCGIVLIQESKGGGLASSFSSSNQIMGVRKTTDFLEKGTWVLAGTMVVLSVVSTAFVSKTDSKDGIINVAPQQTSTDAENVQSFGQAPEAPATDKAPAETPAKK